MRFKPFIHPTRVRQQGSFLLADTRRNQCRWLPRRCDDENKANNIYGSTTSIEKVYQTRQAALAHLNAKYEVNGFVASAWQGMNAGFRSTSGLLVDLQTQCGCRGRPTAPFCQWNHLYVSALIGTLGVLEIMFGRNRHHRTDDISAATAAAAEEERVVSPLYLALELRARRNQNLHHPVLASVARRMQQGPQGVLVSGVYAPSVP